MSLHPDYHQWATGEPPDVNTSNGPPDVATGGGHADVVHLVVHWMYASSEPLDADMR